jgi:uncharacterized membrane protein
MMGTRPPSSPSGPALFGLEPRVAAMLTYAPCCVGLVFSILVAALEKQNRALRFNAFQSLLIHGVIVGLSLILWVVGLVLAAIAGVLGFLSTMVMGMVGLIGLALLVLLMIKTYGGEEIELPFLGETARKLAAR